MTPDYLNEVIRETEYVVSEANLAIIKKLAEALLKQFNRYGEITIIPSTLKQFKALMNTGMVAENIEYELARVYPEIQKEIHKAFLKSASEMAIEQQDVARSIIEVEGIEYELKKIPEQQIVTTKASELNLAPSQIRILENAYSRTSKEIKNLTNTAGQCTELAFSDLCDSVYMQVRHGKSMNQAVIEAIDGLAKQGVMVRYGNRLEHIETALPRAVRTAINQTNGEIVLQGCAEMGVHWVKVSEHLGARVTGTSDYTDHSWWQGKVYSLDWSKKALAGHTPSDIGKLPEYMQVVRKELI